MKSVEEKVYQLFIATDQKDWETVLNVFDRQVDLDYSSMSGQPEAVLKAEDIVSAWKSLLPGFTQTHHQIGNVMVSGDDTHASVFAYGTATHFIEGEGVWVVVGSYDFDLIKRNEKWRITKMTFNFKYQDGNVLLPEIAIKKVEENK